jgi:imidazolonepropionase-like amidohydrolase
MAETGVAWTPTLTTVAGALEWLVGNVPPAKSAARSWLERMRRNVAFATRVGLTLLTGTDEKGAGSVAAEAARLVEFGATPRAAIAAACTSARAFLGMPGLVPGAPADLVTFEHDPRDDITALAHPTVVVLNGTVPRP